MAKRKHHRKHRRGMGSTLVVRQGLGKVMGLKGPGMAANIVPAAIGAGVVGLTVLGIRHFVNPAAGTTQAMLFKQAGWIGLGAGAVASAALYVLGGTKSAAIGAVSAVGVGGALLATDMLIKSSTTYVAGIAGLGAIVPEYAGMQGLGGGGLGALVMSPQLGGPRGESVSLGAINPAAFGTPGFQP